MYIAHLIGDATTGFEPKPFNAYTQEKKKTLYIETKVYSTLTMAIPDNYFHQVGSIKICAFLFQNIKMRRMGNIEQSNKVMLKFQFITFNFFENRDC